MKYLEELSPGDCFTHGDKHYIVSTDFKNDGRRMTIELSSGSIRWLDSSSIIDIIDAFTLDKDNNIISFKYRKKDVNN